jgi:putative aldouronate transport system substrate-binding protein
MRENVSNGTGNLYALPNKVGNRPQQIGTLNNGPYMRWEYYKEQGMPVINEIEDYLPLIKKILDAHPVNEAGQKMYGLVGFNDWDANARMALSEYVGNFYAVQLPAIPVEVDYKNNSIYSMLEDHSYYKRGIKFWFTANRMGLLDPDSVNQGWNDYLTKVNAGRIIFNFWPWGSGEFNTPARAEKGIGFQMVPFTNEKLLLPTPDYIGGMWSYQIAKNTKKLDAALRFVDYMYSHEGTLNLRLGRRGVAWDIDEAGEPYLTRLGWDIRTRAREFPNGGYFDDGLKVINSWGLSTLSVNPIIKKDLEEGGWIKKDFAPADSSLVSDWKKSMNAEDDLDYFRKHNILVPQSYAPLNAAPDNIMQIATRIGSVVQQRSWQMVYAESEAEFNRIWEEMQRQAKDMGADTVIQWYKNEFNRSLEANAKYTR